MFDWAAAGNNKNGQADDPVVTVRRMALAVAGIGEPVRSELANRLLIPAKIRDATARQPNARLLVLDLRAMADQAEAKAAQPEPDRLIQEPPAHHRPTVREPGPKPISRRGPSYAGAVPAKRYDEDHDPQPRATRAQGVA